MSFEVGNSHEAYMYRVSYRILRLGGTLFGIVNIYVCETDIVKIMPF